MVGPCPTKGGGQFDKEYRIEERARQEGKRKTKLTLARKQAQVMMELGLTIEDAQNRSK